VTPCQTNDSCRPPVSSCIVKLVEDRPASAGVSNRHADSDRCCAGHRSLCPSQHPRDRFRVYGSTLLHDPPYCATGGNRNTKCGQNSESLNTGVPWGTSCSFRSSSSNASVMTRELYRAHPKHTKPPSALPLAPSSTRSSPEILRSIVNTH